MFTSPGEIAFNLFIITIHYYGIIMAVSMLTGIFFAKYICKKYYAEINSEIIYSIAPIIMISAILGARLYYCLLCYNYFIENPSEILQIWHGGLSIHGGIIGGLIGGIAYAKIKSLPILKLCDIFSFGIVLGQIIGRWGNFFNSEAFGLPYNGILKLYIPLSKRPIELMQYEYFHPTFLYESIANIFVLTILLLLLKNKKKFKSGTIFFVYLILYSMVRILVEQIRIDSVLNISGIPFAQLISYIIIAISVISIVYINKKTKSEEDLI